MAALTEVLLADGGNLADVSMTLLQGQFAMTLVVDVAARVERVRADLAPVAEQLDMAVSVRATSPDTDDVRPPSAPYLLRVHGADRPGLLHRTTRLLADYDCNITDLSTRLVGEAAVYVMLVAVDVPTSAPVEGLVQAVRELASELEVEASLRPADSEVL